MLKKKDLIRTKEYWLETNQNLLYNMIENYLEENQLSRSDFARQLGVTKGYVSQVMNGHFDHSLSKLIELSLAAGYAPLFQFEKLPSNVSGKKTTKAPVKGRRKSL